MSDFSVIKFTETQTALISLCSDNIMRVVLKKGAEIDLEKARENIQAYINMIEGKKYAFLIYAENEDGSIVYTEDARKNAKVHEKMFDKTCVAVIVKHLAHRLIANFYIKFYKPSYPFRVFEKIEQAEAWCLEMNNSVLSEAQTIRQA